MCGKTKKIILFAIIIAVLQLLIFSGASFSGTVENSKHNLSLISGGGGNFQSAVEDEICIFCHTPHNAIVDIGDGIRLPLWNRSIIGLAGLNFQLYASATFNASLSGGENTQTQPRGMTLLCLSCHDGVSALNVLHNYGRSGPAMTGNPDTDMIGGSGANQLGDPGFYEPTNPLLWQGANIGGAYVGGGENIRDLSDDHPVSFTYDTNLKNVDGGLKDPGSIAPLRLFNGRLECATCHNPHDQGDEVLGTFPFLRMSNLNSEMCITCHNK